MSIKKTVAKATKAGLLAALALSTMLVVGCSDDGDDDNGGSGGSNGGDPALVGYWEYIEDGQIPNYNKSFLNLTSSGGWCFVYFQKVDDFWIESSECYGTWRVEGNYFILWFTRYDMEFGRFTYSFSGDTLTVTGTTVEDDEPVTESNVRVNVSAFRNSIGPTRVADPALARTNWRMSSASGNRELAFYTHEMWSDAGYLGTVWYTNGSTMFVIRASRTDCSLDGEDCALVSEEIIELTYTHTPGISLRLRNTSLGIDDLWEYVSWDDYMFDIANTNRRANSLFGRKQTRDR